MIGYVPHASEQDDVGRPFSVEEADALAEAMRAFGTGSRLRLLWAMLDEERTVEQLARLTGMSQSAASQQLRLLRQARLVRVRREGRHSFYGLYDHHLVDLLAAIRHHNEHVNHLGSPAYPDRSRRMQRS